MAKKDEQTPEMPGISEVAEIAEIAETAEAASEVPEPPVTEDENPAPEIPPGSEITPDTHQSLGTLAAKHRVPAWQAAALNRFMGWEPGKLVSDVEYQTALSGLNSRRLGGGRKE